VLASMVSLVMDGLLFGLVILGRYLLPGLLLILMFLVGSILLVLELLAVATGLLVLSVLLVIALLLCKLKRELELALEFSKEGNKPLLFTRLGTPNVLDLQEGELCRHLGHEVLMDVGGAQVAVMVALLFAKDVLLKALSRTVR
jgi:hypothetical protein